MTELTRPTMPAEPVAPPIVARYHELLTAFHRDRTRLDTLVSRDRNDNEPNPDLIGRTDPEKWSWHESSPEVRFSQAERLAELQRRAEARIAEIQAHLVAGQTLASYFTEHEAEIVAYQTARDEWRAECDRLEREHYEAKHEARQEVWRKTFTVGRRVRPAHARNYWEIIARNGKGAIIKELRYDDKPARIRELADVLEVALNV